jgi:hypothetical protein
MSYEDEPLDDFHRDDSFVVPNKSSDRVRLPAIFLIIVGVLNILGAMLYAFTGVNGIVNTENNERVAEQFNLPATDPATAKTAAVFYLCLCVVTLLAAAVTILGGIRMLSLKSYGLAVFASVLAAIPCISVMGCCGLGEGIGVWSLIVLLNSEVRSAFS